MNHLSGSWRHQPVQGKFLVVSDSEEFSLLIIQCLSMEWPLIDVDEFIPSAWDWGKTGPDLSGYDGVFVDYHPDAEQGYQSWLGTLQHVPEKPAVTLVISGRYKLTEEQVTAMGADNCVTRQEQCHSQLIVLAREALRTRGKLGIHGRTENVAVHSKDSPEELLVKDTSKPRIKGYELSEEIGRSSLSSVYLARRNKERRQMVLKVLDTQIHVNDEILKQFIDEYETAQALDARHVVHIFDQGFTDRHVYIAMEYLPKGDLRGRINQGLRKEQCLRYLTEMAEALQDIHRLGILHRDIKPSNVMFRQDETLGLVDFGIAGKLLSRGETDSSDDSIIGTLGYMSPEQMMGANLDARSDLFSAGIVFHEMLTGARPELGNPFEKTGGAGDIPPRLPEVLADCQGIIDQLIVRDPEKRCRSAAALLDAITLVAGSSSEHP